MKKQKQKELLDEIINTESTDKTTEIVVEDTSKKVKKEDTKPVIRMFPDA